MTKKDKGKKKKQLTYDIDVLRELIYYYPETGLVYWRTREVAERKHWSKRGAKSFNTRLRNRSTLLVGHKKHVVERDYVRLETSLPNRKDPKTFVVARLIWAWMTGSWPPEGHLIDHIDQNPMNNKWENLRCVTEAENGQNYRRRGDNTSGVTGVSFDNKNDVWKHDTQFNKVRYLSYHDDFDEAVRHRMLLAKFLGFSENHGTTKEERELIESGGNDNMVNGTGVYQLRATKEWLTLSMKDGTIEPFYYDTLEEAQDKQEEET